MTCDWQESKGVIKVKFNLILINFHDDSEEVKSSIIYDDIISTTWTFACTSLWTSFREHSCDLMYMWVSEF